ncbi:MAG: hypothetical protein EOO39_42965 [Cytophagaceae bacterium]|nr:MAG: hypothetical protein EOO39_42965 [Cytophagaceae bacterium]
MTSPLLTPPGDGYQRVRLLVRLGPLMPVGKEGWAKAESKQCPMQAGKRAFRFVSATNHDLVFKVYAEEIELL